MWPFETGARLPSRTEARIVIVEIYPSLHHTRLESPDVHDKQQVEAAVAHFARQDRGTLAELFESVPADPDVLGEEGWILGTRSESLDRRPELR